MIFKTLMFIALLANFTNPIPDFVKEFHLASTKNRELSFIAKHEKSDNLDVLAYVVSLKMKQSKYKFFPWNKMSVFRTEKNNLEELIQKEPNNIHLRYVRLIIQESVPSFLGYNSNIKEDKVFLKKLLAIKDTTDYLDFYILKHTSL